MGVEIKGKVNERYEENISEFLLYTPEGGVCIPTYIYDNTEVMRKDVFVGGEWLKGKI